MCISILFFFFQQFSRTVLVDQESLEKDILAIDPDIPRTHRELAFNQNEGLMGLMVVRDILITYSAQYPVHGYTQGMTDVASCFYEALDSKAEEFFCFCNYMRRYRVDYMPQGLTKKIEPTLILTTDVSLQGWGARECRDRGARRSPDSTSIFSN
nr:PREDICTED: TBC1 domain family member 25-like [Latimeria chalumnae]|eukprot:XP_014354368.1 PREDICTED: TBC1 domain family member 25-like [Latimeria chalumnae]